jgi:hypothetical protein
MGRAPTTCVGRPPFIPFEEHTSNQSHINDPIDLDEYVSLGECSSCTNHLGKNQSCYPWSLIIIITCACLNTKVPITMVVHICRRLHKFTARDAIIIYVRRKISFYVHRRKHRSRFWSQHTIAAYLLWLSSGARHNNSTNRQYKNNNMDHI